MSNKERYRQLCESVGSAIPIFQQHWWMEAVCQGKRWDVLLSYRGGRIAGALPFLYGRRFSLRYVLQPQLTQYSGPWLSTALGEEERLRTIDDLAEQVDDMHLALFAQHFSPTIDNWLPFYWRGYHQTTRYTYRFDPLRPVDELMAAAQPQRRKRLGVLAEQCEVDRAVPVDEFAQFHHAYFTQRDGFNLVPQQLVEEVCRTAIGREQGLIYGLRDRQGRLLVADFVVYDDRQAHSLLSGMSGAAPRNANSLLFWTILGDLYGRTQAFDFEGSMDKGIGQFFRSFGATATPLMQVYRSRIPLATKLLHLG